MGCSLIITSNDGTIIFKKEGCFSGLVCKSQEALSLV